VTPVYVPSLPDLEPAPCPDCQGEGGHHDDHTKPGQACTSCNGSGEIEVCPNCHTQPYVVAGIEACGCTVAVFALTDERAA
jgi:DnaJ-class molecular chaperone